jgi:hypothetical protein
VILASGREQLPPEHRDAVLLRKPYDVEALKRSLEKL